MKTSTSTSTPITVPITGTSTSTSTNVRRWPALSALFAALLLAGCASTSSFQPGAAPVPPAAFKQAGPAETSAAPVPASGRWWEVFGDAQLNTLVNRADAGNTSIQSAAARLAQARALLQHADAQRLPQLGLGAAASRGNLSTPGSVRPATVVSAGVQASWEPDLFGRLAQASSAAALDAQASTSLLQGARLLVQGDVAQTYFVLRALDDERALVRESVAAYRDTLRLTERRHAAGDVAELDLARVQAEVAATESQALALDRRRAQLEHALAVLLGELPSSFTLAEAPWQALLPVVPAGVPSAVLTRRPDVLAAQQAMQAAQARVGVAQSAWFPDLSLTASGGGASNELSQLFKASARSWGVGALLSLPLLDGGRRDAGVQIANAQWDAAAATYRQQVLAAFQDVEDQLAAMRLLDQQAQAQDQAVLAATRATALSGTRYRNGLVSQLELLDARRSELGNRRQAVQLQAARYQATVGLIRALGGGWD